MSDLEYKHKGKDWKFDMRLQSASELPKAVPYKDLLKDIAGDNMIEIPKIVQNLNIPPSKP